MLIEKNDILYIINESIRRILEEYNPEDPNPLNKTYISFGSNHFDKTKISKIENIGFINKPFGGFWGAELYDEGGSDWSDFVKREGMYSKTLSSHVVFKLKPEAKIYVINDRDDVDRYTTNRFMSGLIVGVMFDFARLQKAGFDGVFLTRKGELLLGHNYNRNIPDFSTWDLPSICVFNPEVIEVVSENIIDFDHNTGDDIDFDKEADDYNETDSEEKRNQIIDNQIDRMYRKYQNLNIHPNMEKFFNGKQLGIMAQGDDKDAEIARKFKGSVKND